MDEEARCWRWLIAAVGVLLVTMVLAMNAGRTYTLAQAFAHGYCETTQPGADWTFWQKCP